MNKRIAVYLIFLISSISTVHGKISISLSPSFPVSGESFNVIFSIETNKNFEPFLNFDPSGVEVIGRSKAVSNQIQFVNGRTTSKTTHIFTYEMTAPAARTAYLRNITADIGSETLNHKDVSIKISKELKQSGDTFILAEVSNDNPYIGEGVDVRYYLYTRDRNLVSVEVKEFPKLNGFIKRFHKLQEKEEVVQYDGQVYRRYLKYSARVFPEKVGDLKVDPLKLTLRYNTSQNRIGFFGSGFGKIRERSKGSNSVKILVKSLPAENVPSTFTGLVGKHTAKLEMNRAKYLINEPIELRLEVNGEGALEKLEAPQLWKSELLEDFDTKSEYVDIDAYTGRKIFDYTYLVRGNGTIPSMKKELFYFDPETSSYIPMKVELLELTLSGGSAQKVSRVTSDGPSDKKQDVAREESEKTQVMAPVFDDLSIFNKLTTPSWLIKILAFFLIILLVFHAYMAWLINKSEKACDKFLKIIYKKGITYKRLSDYILSLRDKNTDTDIKSIIKESRLSKGDKDYFLSLISKLEEQVFFDGLNDNKKIKIERKSFESIRSLMS